MRNENLAGPKIMGH